MDPESKVTETERTPGTLYNAYTAVSGLCFAHVDLGALVSLWSHRLAADYSAQGDKIWSL